MKQFVFFVVFFGGAGLAAVFGMLALSLGIMGFAFGFIFAIDRMHKAATGRSLMTDDKFNEVLDRIF